MFFYSAWNLFFLLASSSLLIRLFSRMDLPFPLCSSVSSVNSIFGILMWTKIPITFNSVLTCVIGIFRINEQIFWICGLMIKYLMLIVWINYPIFALNKSYFWNMRKCFYWRFLHKWDVWDFFFTKLKSKSIKGKWFSK